MSKGLRMVTLLFFTLSTVLPQIMAGKQELQAVVDANGQFTKQLYNILSKGEGNVFFSPISAHAVLVMAYQGAGGTTKNAFAQALCLPDALQAADGYKDVIANLNNISDVQLLMANKIYIMQGHTLNSAFKEVTQTKFASEVESVNFANAGASAKTINTWVEEKTQNKIKDLITPDSLDSSTRLVLVNAIYFKGSWASKFDKSLTKTEKFYLNDNDSVDVQMMTNKGKYFYKEDESLDAKILELPYSNPALSLIVILPNKRNGIAELEKKLVNYDITKITQQQMYKPEVVVKLPKFKIETTINLNEPLSKMGLGEIFGESADFSGMLESKQPLKVSKVIQKAFIEVSEEGTEAAAATAIMFQTTSFRAPPRPKDFTADHPFVVILRRTLHEETHAKNCPATIVLFQGRVAKPKV